jgi:phosphoribosylglycinamide formyltransferase-1
MHRKRTAILFSGRGSNMAAIIRAAEQPDYPAEIVAVISNRSDALGIEFARARGLATHVIDSKAQPSREAFDRELDRRLRGSGIDLVACAGFMRIMTAGFVESWLGRMINIHPSLLPLYRGLDTHARALADGVRIHGCTIHFVTPELDSGPIIAQAAVPVLPGDTEASLAARVLAAEHRLYPKSLALVAVGAARLEGGKAVVEAACDTGATLFSPPA